MNKNELKKENIHSIVSQGNSNKFVKNHYFFVLRKKLVKFFSFFFSPSINLNNFEFFQKNSKFSISQKS